MSRARRVRGLALVAGVAALTALAERRRRAASPAAGVDAFPDDLPGAAPLADRSGEPTALGSGHLVAPSWEPASLTALARWVPAAPRTSGGRALALLWAAPLTLAGAVLAALSLVTPRRRDGVWVAAPARGLFGAWFVRRDFVACTLGHVIVAANEPDARLLAHELVHVRQGERLGPLMGPAYVALMVAYGYARHPMERAARAGARARS